MTDEEIYEIAYKLKNLPEMTRRMLERNVKLERLHNLTCEICRKTFLYAHSDKKTCSTKCSASYERKVKNSERP